MLMKQLWYFLVSLVMAVMFIGSQDGQAGILQNHVRAAVGEVEDSTGEWLAAASSGYRYRRHIGWYGPVEYVTSEEPLSLQEALGNGYMVYGGGGEIRIELSPEELVRFRVQGVDTTNGMYPFDATWGGTSARAAYQDIVYVEGYANPPQTIWLTFELAGKFAGRQPQIPLQWQPGTTAEVSIQRGSIIDPEQPRFADPYDSTVAKLGFSYNFTNNVWGARLQHRADYPASSQFWYDGEQYRYWMSVSVPVGAYYYNPNLGYRFNLNFTARVAADDGGEALIDSLHTVRFVSVLDEHGEVIPPGYLRFDSGMRAPSGTIVPEPAALTMIIGGGFGGLFVRMLEFRRRRNVKRQPTTGSRLGHSLS